MCVSLYYSGHTCIHDILCNNLTIMLLVCMWYVGHPMLQAGSPPMCGFATGGMQMVMVGSVEVEQVNCCVL